MAIYRGFVDDGLREARSEQLPHNRPFCGRGGAVDALGRRSDQKVGVSDPSGAPEPHTATGFDNNGIAVERALRSSPGGHPRTPRADLVKQGRHSGMSGCESHRWDRRLLRAVVNARVEEMVMGLRPEHHFSESSSPSLQGGLNAPW